uniref:BKRF1 encodes EBNA-1 protein-like n=1 Tax=Oryza nivara TaxID=4536 RepID=A0A679BCE1_ORYNI|nr:BKRF1 encodes EBNA-1 protein -like [Oryza sativa f. spontanea]
MRTSHVNKKDRAACLTDADDGRERLDGGTNATTTGNDGRTTTTTTGAGEETTRAAGSGCTEARMARNTPLRCRRRRRRREMTSRATDGTSTTRTIGGDDDGPRRGLDGGETMPRTALPLRCRRWWRCGRPVHGVEGRAAEQLRRGGWRGSRRCAAASGRNRGVDEVEGYVTVPRERTAAPADARAWRKGLPEETSTRRKVRPARATVFRRYSGEEEVMPGMRAALRSRGRWWRRRPALRGRGRGGRRRNRGGNTTVAGGEALPEVSAGNRGEPSTGEGGTATGRMAGGHGWWPGKVRPFPMIGGAIQGGIKGERERRERGLIPPNQFGNPMLDSRGFEGVMALGFAREGERGRPGGRKKATAAWRVGPTRGARSARVRRACVGGRGGSAWAERRPRRRGGGGGLGRAGREGRGGREAAREGEGGGRWAEGKGAQEEGEKERERKRGRKGRLRPRAEGREGGLWAKIGPKEKEDYF